MTNSEAIIRRRIILCQQRAAVYHQQAEFHRDVDSLGIASASQHWAARNSAEARHHLFALIGDGSRE